MDHVVVCWKKNTWREKKNAWVNRQKWHPCRMHRPNHLHSSMHRSTLVFAGDLSMAAITASLADHTNYGYLCLFCCILFWCLCEPNPSCIICVIAKYFVVRYKSHTKMGKNQWRPLVWLRNYSKTKMDWRTEHWVFYFGIVMNSSVFVRRHFLHRACLPSFFFFLLSCAIRIEYSNRSRLTMCEIRDFPSHVEHERITRNKME